MYNQVTDRYKFVEGAVIKAPPVLGRMISSVEDYSLELFRSKEYLRSLRPYNLQSGPVSRTRPRSVRKPEQMRVYNGDVIYKIDMRPHSIPIVGSFKTKDNYVRIYDITLDLVVSDPVLFAKGYSLGKDPVHLAIEIFKTAFLRYVAKTEHDKLKVLRQPDTEWNDRLSQDIGMKIAQISQSTIRDVPEREELSNITDEAQPHITVSSQDVAGVPAAPSVQPFISARELRGSFYVNPIKIAFIAYAASLAMTGIMVPFFSSLITILIYLALPSGSLLPLLTIDTISSWYALVTGGILTGILWLVVAVPYCYFTTTRGANLSSYVQLKSRLSLLIARLEQLELIEQQEGTGIDKDLLNQRLALTEVYTACEEMNRKLHTSPAGLPWSLGFGYINLWRLLHHAEEALIEIAPIEEVIRGAMHNKLAIKGSTIVGKDELLVQLNQAVEVLQPMALLFFNEQPREAAEQPQSLNGSNVKTVARVVLREVCSTLNEFQDRSRERMVRARNRLLVSMIITGFVTYCLLAIVILTSPSPIPHGSTTPAQVTVLAATVFYFVGAIAGLFVRFYFESRISRNIDDFGLSKARMMVLPLLSGLGAIGGVLFVTVLLAVFGGFAAEKSISLSTLFTFTPYLLLVAALFGIIPNLIMKGFKEQVNVSEGGAQHYKKATGADEIEPSMSTLIDRQLDQIYNYDVNQLRRWFGVGIVAAGIGFLVILSGVAVLFTGNTLLGVVVLLSGSLPEIGAVLAFQQSKHVTEQLRQRGPKVQEGTPSEPLASPPNEQEQETATTSSSSHARSNEP